jgi:hypothetical protein
MNNKYKINYKNIWTAKLNRLELNILAPLIYSSSHSIDFIKDLQRVLNIANSSSCPTKMWKASLDMGFISYVI